MMGKKFHEEILRERSIENLVKIIDCKCTQYIEDFGHLKRHIQEAKIGARRKRGQAGQRIGR